MSRCWIPNSNICDSLHSRKRVSIPSNFPRRDSCPDISLNILSNHIWLKVFQLVWNYIQGQWIRWGSHPRLMQEFQLMRVRMLHTNAPVHSTRLGNWPDCREDLRIVIPVWAPCQKARSYLCWRYCRKVCSGQKSIDFYRNWCRAFERTHVLSHSKIVCSISFQLAEVDCHQYLKQMTQEDILSFDGSWDHSRNASKLIGILLISAWKR